MRAIDKGGSPYKEIDEYQDAIPYLEKKIGLYCSYCEMSIKHVPEVEHKISRKNGGDWTAWSNLLLGCKYCNTRKAAKITPQNVGEYLWPDSDNTAVAFSYTNGIPKVNEDILSALDPTGICCEKARKIHMKWLDWEIYRYKRMIKTEGLQAGIVRLLKQGNLWKDGARLKMRQKRIKAL